MGNPPWAKGECQRSGKVLPLVDMVEDGATPGLLVAPDWYEPQQPQETPAELGEMDTLDNPAPRNDAIDQTIRFPLYDVTTGKRAAELFELLAYNGDLSTDAFKVALYDSKPPAVYDANDLLTPKPVSVVVANGAAHLSDTVWTSVTAYPTWALVFNEATGEGLLRVNLASPQGCVNATFTIEWDGMTYSTDGTRITGVKIAR